MAGSEPGAVDLGIAGIEPAIEIGRGGFGIVYRAFQPRFDRTVGVKVLPVRADERQRERFETECRAIGMLSGHPNTVTVFDSGFSESGHPYLVMEYLADGSLADRIARVGPLPWEEAIAIGIKLCGAVEMAHRNGLLHRDIKPENVLLSPYGEPCLTDFGLARMQGGSVSRTGSVTTSLAHAAPEIIAGQQASTAADVYALGSTIFELLAGNAAFVRDSDDSLVPVLARIATDPVPDLRSSGIPDAVCHVIEQAMAKDPAQRPPSAEALGRELQDAQRAAGLDVAAMPLVSAAQAGGNGPTSAAGRNATTTFRRPNREDATMPPPAPSEIVGTPAPPPVALAPVESPPVAPAADVPDTAEVEPEVVAPPLPPLAGPAAPVPAVPASAPSAPAAWTPPPPFPTPTPQPDVDVDRRVGESTRPPRKPPWPVIISAAAVVLVAVLVVALVGFVGGGGNKTKVADKPTETTALAPAPASAAGPTTELTSAKLDSGLRVHRGWQLTGDRGDLLVAELSISNPTKKTVTDRFEEVIPKELASNVSKVKFTGSNPKVIKADPIVEYRISVKAKQTRKIGYKITVPARGLDDGRLAAWKKAWTKATSTRKKELAAIAKLAAAAKNPTVPTNPSGPTGHTGSSTGTGTGSGTGTGTGSGSGTGTRAGSTGCPDGSSVPTGQSCPNPNRPPRQIKHCYAPLHPGQNAYDFQPLQGPGVSSPCITDTDHDTLRFTSVWGASHGTVEIVSHSGIPAIRYTPNNPSAPEQDGFSFTVSDGRGGSLTASGYECNANFDCTP